MGLALGHRRRRRGAHRRGAGRTPPEHPVGQARSGSQRALFSAQEELILGTGAVAGATSRRARAAYRGVLRALACATDAPAADRALRRALGVAGRAARARRRRALAAARGEVRAALFGGAYAVTLDRRRPRRRRHGALVAAAARLPHRHALHAPGRGRARRARPARRGKLAPARGAARGRQGPARRLPGAPARAAQGRRRRRARRASPPARRRPPPRPPGYWEILAPRYRQDRGAAAAAGHRGAFAALRAAAERGDRRPPPAPAARSTRRSTASPPRPSPPRSRPAAPSSSCASSRSCRSSTAAASRTTASRKDFEIQEAIAFGTAADAAFDDLRDQLAKRDPARTDAIGARDRPALRRGHRRREQEDRRRLPRRGRDGSASKIEDQLGDVMPAAWQKPTDDSDYDLIALTLDRMEAAVGAGQRRQAEQARLEAYAFFEFGPERRLKSIDPGLATDVEGLIWFGAKGHDGLAELISKGASRRELRDTRLALDAQLEDARAHARRQREPHDRRHQRGDHRLPRGPRGGADPRRHHRLVRRHPPAAAAPGARRRRARPARQRLHLGARPDAAAVARRSTARSSRRWSG